MYINKAKKIVIKLGSSTVIDKKGKFKKSWVNSLIKDIKKYKKNRDFVIVSSGAIALGQSYLKIKKKKIKIEMSQAIASVGQILLAGEFQRIFNKNNFKTGQVLISLDDTEQRRRALNVKRTFENLFKLGAIPIVNENDTTATSEIKYGDNDRLASRVAQITNADMLILLSDVDGLYTKNPKIFKDAKLIKKVNNLNEDILNINTKGLTDLGSGGMDTKIEAAKICNLSGCNMIIANGLYLNPIKQIEEKGHCTWFVSKISKLQARKRWIISSVSPKGELLIDDGAKKAIKSGKSLLAAGIKKVIGKFDKGDHIKILDNKNKEFARALSSFSSDEINKIMGCHSNEIQKILGYVSKSEVVHKDDMVEL